MELAFWDSSSLVPLCTEQMGTPLLQQLSERFDMVVWWATPVEVRSAFARELRAGFLNAAQHRQIISRLEELKDGWREIQPTEDLRQLAESMLERYALRAADALQLAAAHTWSMNRPFNKHFICGDKRLLGAAKEAGFRIIDTA
jgi:predicted nucleic acid-binding protein